MIDSVNKFAISTTAKFTEQDFKNDFLFPLCYVATDLVTLLELIAIGYATTLRHLGQTRNGYVATYFILLSSTTGGSATSDYAVVPERFRQNEEPASRNDEVTKKKPLILLPAVDLVDAICKNMQTWILFIILMFYIFCTLPMFSLSFSNFLLRKIFFIFRFCH